MKRYKAINFEYEDAFGTGTAIDIIEDPDGEFVRYKDVSLILKGLSSLKQLVYDFQTGKADVDNIIEYVHMDRILSNIFTML